MLAYNRKVDEGKNAVSTGVAALFCLVGYLEIWRDGVMRVADRTRGRSESWRRILDEETGEIGGTERWEEEPLGVFFSLEKM